MGEDQLHLIGPAQVEVFPDDRIDGSNEERPRPVNRDRDHNPPDSVAGTGRRRAEEKIGPLTRGQCLRNDRVMSRRGLMFVGLGRGPSHITRPTLVISDRRIESVNLEGAT